MASKLTNLLYGAVLLIAINLCSCTDYNYIDGGRANGIHDCTMWEYFHNQTTDWDSTIIMIEHAGLKSLFDGTGEHKQITFFGITDLCIVRYMFDHNRLLDNDKKEGIEVKESDYWHRVTDIPANICKTFLERLIIPERIMLQDIPEGSRLLDPDGKKYIETDGKVIQSLTERLFTWVYREDFGGVAKKGAGQLWIARRLSTAGNCRIASTDIQTTNGVVQALGYDFDMTNF